MARSLFVTSIAKVMRETWPTVRDTLEGYRAKGGRTGGRTACEETIWALAHQGRLRTESEIALQTAVQRYFDTFEVDESEPTEVGIYQALLKLKAEQDALDVEAERLAAERLLTH